VCLAVLATLTGLEPATSAVTGRRANQLRHRALISCVYCSLRHCRRARTPNGIRTRATAVKGRRPRPLDDGGQSPNHSGGTRNATTVGSHASLGHRRPNPQTSSVRVAILAQVSWIVTAPIAQLVELRTFNPQVLGSSPSGGTTRTSKSWRCDRRPGAALSHPVGRLRQHRINIWTRQAAR
jgi:hypothetical protein